MDRAVISMSALWMAAAAQVDVRIVMEDIPALALIIFTKFKMGENTFLKYFWRQKFPSINKVLESWQYFSACISSPSGFEQYERDPGYNQVKIRIFSSKEWKDYQSYYKFIIFIIHYIIRKFSAMR